MKFGIKIFLKDFFISLKEKFLALLVMTYFAHIFFDKICEWLDH